MLYQNGHEMCLKKVLKQIFREIMFKKCFVIFQTLKANNLYFATMDYDRVLDEYVGQFGLWQKLVKI